MDLRDASPRSPINNTVGLRRRKERFENHRRLHTMQYVREGGDGILQDALMLLAGIRRGCGRAGFLNQNRVRATGVIG